MVVHFIAFVYFFCKISVFAHFPILIEHTLKGKFCFPFNICYNPLSLFPTQLVLNILLDGTNTEAIQQKAH